MKKFLSLVLTLALALSLVTVSAGATDFEDDGDITYQEAIDVIAGIGIVDGYSDGTFGPDEVLTRGAAAKIICNLILGPTTASVLSATSAPFADVPVTNTFAGYITYCSQQGIISGYSDGTFRPSGTLTGNAFMKMLLGALGYDSTIEGYTGANWNVSVLKQAVGIGLNDGNDDFLGSQAVTRQEACLYAFNMLKATMVEYSNASTIVVGDVTVSTSSTRSDVENTTKTDGNIDDDGLMQFAEKYFSDLVAEDDTDSFGRPATTWNYDGDDLGTYANDADETYVLDDEDDLVTLMTDGDCLNYSSKDILSTAEVYYNGTLVGKYSSLTDKELAGAGDILEAYENDDGDVETIVFRSYTYAKVDEVITDLSSTHENKGASVGIDLVDIDGNSFGTFYDDYNDSDKVLSGYNSSYDEGTVLAIALSDDGAVLDSYVMESVTDTPTAAKEVATYTNDRKDTIVKSGNITIGGTKYGYAAKMTGIGNGENVDFDEEYTVYLTAEGYVLAVDGDSTAALNDVYYVAGVYKSTSSGRSTYYLEAVSVSDGTVYDLPLSSTGKDQFGKPDSYDASVAGLYVLDEDDDEYFIDADYASSTQSYTVGRLDDGDEVGSYTVAISALSQDVTSSSTTIRFSNSSISRLYLTDSTFFVAVEGDAEEEDISVSTATGVMTVDISECTGLTAYAFYKDDDGDAVFVVYAATELSGAVNINDVVYLTDDADTKTSDGYLADLFFLGTMSLEEDVIIDSSDDQGFYAFELNDDGIYELSTNTSFRLKTGEVEDNEDGYAEGVTFTEVRSSRATGSTSTDGETGKGGIDFVSVSFADAEIIDTRSSSDKNSALYGSDIESASALSTAINRGWVKADVFVDDGEIVFVAVVATEDESGSSSSGSGSSSSDSGEYFTAKATIYNTGYAVVSLTVNRPEYIENSNALEYTYDVYVDGVPYDVDKTGSIPANKDTYTDSWSNSSTYYIVPVDSSAEITIENFAFTASSLAAQNYVLQIVDEEGNDLSSKLAKPISSGWTISASSTSGRVIQFNTGVYASGGTFTVTKIENATYTSTLPITGTVATSDATITGLKADTTGYVIITVDTSNLDAYTGPWSITTASGDDDPNVTLDKYGITGDTSASLSITGASNITNGTNYDLSNIKVRLSGTPAAYSYKVTISGLGSVTLTGTTEGSLSGVIKVEKNIEITKDMVSVSVVEKKMTITGGSWSGNTLTLTFSEDVNTASKGTVETTGTYEWNKGTGSNTSSSIFSATLSATDTVTLTFTGEDLAVGNTIAVKASSSEIQGPSASNKLNSDVTITLAANGKVTIS